VSAGADWARSTKGGESNRMHYELIVLGLVCFIAPWLARLGGYETGRKPFDFVGIGGIFFLLSAAFSVGNALFTWMAGFGKMMLIGSFGLGLLMLLIGALWEMIAMLRSPMHALTHKA
jgi:hypothetical protein